jgi:hypothetical protein
MMGTHQLATRVALHQGWGSQALVLAAVATTVT